MAPRTWLVSLVLLGAWPRAASAQSQTLVLQRGTLGTVQDAYIWASDNNYNGNNEALYTGVISAFNKMTFIRFDLGLLPSEIVIEDATLSLYEYSVSNLGDMTVRVHRVPQAWTETGVTWGNASSNFAPGIEATFLANTTGWHDARVTALVQAWVDGAHPNHGFLLEQEPAGTAYYWSSEVTDVTLRPKLTVRYRPREPDAGVEVDGGPELRRQVLSVGCDCQQASAGGLMLTGGALAFLALLGARGRSAGRGKDARP